MDLLDNYTVRPIVGTLQVALQCGRCKGPVRDHALGGVPTLAGIVAAADRHDKRMHRPKLLQGVSA